MMSAWGAAFGLAWSSAWGSVSSGAAGYDDNKRKRNIVHANGRIYVFGTDKDAIAFLNTLQPDIVEKKQEDKPKPKPVREVLVSDVKQVISNTIERQQIEQSLQFADYAAILAAYDQWLEFDEEEALLLLL